MSGGYFDYDQYKIGYIADSIEQIIQNNKNLKEPKISFSDEVMTKFKEGVRALRIAQIYAQRIDWLVEGDDNEKSFLERLEEELSKIKTMNNTKQKPEITPEEFAEKWSKDFDSQKGYLPNCLAYDEFLSDLRSVIRGMLIKYEEYMNGGDDYIDKFLNENWIE